LEAAELSLTEMGAQIEDLSARLDGAEAAAAEAQSIAARNSETLAMINQLDRDRMIKLDDGSWTRFYFSPGVSSAVVSVGALPKLAKGEYLECWLKKARGGAMLSAGVLDSRAQAKIDHWVIEADEPIGNFSMFMITIEPQNETLFEVPLTQEG
jgi:hypothetical protein